MDTKIDALELHNALARHGWTTIANKGVGSTLRFSWGVLKVEAFSSDWDKLKYGEDYWGDGPQGWTGNMFMIVEHDGTFYRKSGSLDSYGSGSWDGPFEIVKPTEKIVKVWA